MMCDCLMVGKKFQTSFPCQVLQVGIRRLGFHICDLFRAEVVNVTSIWRIISSHSKLRSPGLQVEHF